ncbi:MAG: FMN-binding protein [Butyrivibrio sp.]|nr:FMN-binding protein [Butyrivibrio sp.]
MNLVISLCIVFILILLAGEMLRKKPLPFYVGAASLSIILFALRTFAGLGTIFSFYNSGAIAGAVFVLVMYAGVFPPGSYGAKTFMPLRAQLSIIGGIFAIDHSVFYLRTYLKRIISGNSDIAAIAAFGISVLLFIILVPLWVTSFKIIRKKMDGKKWKKLQRMAYVFYALILVHVLVLMIPKAVRGAEGYVLNVFVYSFIFLSYFMCRIIRAVNKNNKDIMVKRQFVSLALALLIAITGVSSLSGKKDESALALNSTSNDKAIDNTVTDESSIENIDIPEVAGVIREENQGIENEAVQGYSYKDGVYQGEGMGNNGKIVVEVTVESGEIADIQIVKFPDDAEYFDPESDGANMIQSMIEFQNADVDTVSGATYSSEGLIDAVENALAGANN